MDAWLRSRMYLPQYSPMMGCGVAQRSAVPSLLVPGYRSDQASEVIVLSHGIASMSIAQLLLVVQTQAQKTL